ncbi:MAG: hypothetical protein LBD06_12625 [Candidatus Accumulibacter sp.]|nr:hypothetical protein [Accumulibacter sp.]
MSLRRCRAGGDGKTGRSGFRGQKIGDRRQKTERSVFPLLPGAKRRKFICLLSSETPVL